MSHWVDLGQSRWERGLAGGAENIWGNGENTGLLIRVQSTVQVDTRRGDRGATAGHRLARLGARTTEARNQCGAPLHKRWAMYVRTSHSAAQTSEGRTAFCSACSTPSWGCADRSDGDLRYPLAVRSRSSSRAPRHSPRCLCRQAERGWARLRRLVCDAPRAGHHPPVYGR